MEINRIRLKLNRNKKKVGIFSLEDIKTYARVSNVYDGDTLHLTFYLDNRLVRFRCRLGGIDTPELRGKTIDEKTMACDARDYLRKMVDDKIVYVEFGKMDKYSRPLVNLYKNGNNVNQLMIIKGFAVYYDGKGPKCQWV